MLRLRNNSSGKIDTVFVLGLFTMFAATAFLLVLLGIKQYNHTREVSAENYEMRTLCSYLQEKIRQNDSANSIDITILQDSDGEEHAALTFFTTENDITFITYIYYYDGILRELVVTDNSVYSLSSGQSIMDISDFTPEFISNDLLYVTITGSDGRESELYFTINASDGKEVSDSE